jgi:hypothetical protein
MKLIRRNTMAWQLTVSELRGALAECPDSWVVALRFTTPDSSSSPMTIHNLSVASANAGAVILELLDQEPLVAELFNAIEENSVARVLAALDAGADVSSRDVRFGHDAQTPLIAAASNGDTEVVRSLLRTGAAVNLPSGSGWTALMRATNAGNIDCARILLETGADPNHRNDEGYTALGRCPRGHTELNSLLESFGARV